MGEFIKDQLRFVADRLPYIKELRRQVRNAGDFPVGHFNSPVPDRNEVLERIDSGSIDKTDLLNVRLNVDQQFELLKIFESFYGDLPFPEVKTPACRYYYAQNSFCYPDAIFLYSFLRHTKPGAIIEVGSGFSSAVTLDTVDRFFPQPPKITFVEPYPETLKKVLRPEDTDRVTILEKKVQHAPLDLFASLKSGDLLFIDSSHVVKCGSDLQFLLFEVLPRLPVGVYVHFHDIFRTFEYPEVWLRRGWYWNEQYILRAFLANNNTWEICFFNNYVRHAFEDFIAKKMPLCMQDVGGSLYIRRTAND